jgi:hypothetical protein
MAAMQLRFVSAQIDATVGMPAFPGKRWWRGGVLS